jgi:ABC-2 type transport system permease protein
MRRKPADAVRQFVALSRRSTLAIFRQPALVGPSLIFPLFFAALGSSSFSRAISLPGFPKVDSYLQFTLAGTVTQGVLFGSVTGAAALATDIQDGFFDRLLAAPTSRTSILFGRLAGSSLFGALQALIFLLALLPFGVTVQAGLLGYVSIVVAGFITAFAVGALMSVVALKTGSAEAVQGTFPVLFILLFLSSAFFPRETMSGAYRRIADFNPISYMVEGQRSLSIDGVSLVAMTQTLVIPAGIAVLTTMLALRQLSVRLAAR